MKKSCSVIIIGAGLSGLTAAKELSKSNVSFKLFEGQNQIGGRVRTEVHSGIPLDMGATWFHGASRENEAWKFAQDCKLFGETDEDESEDEDPLQGADLITFLTSMPAGVVDSSGKKIELNSEQQQKYISICRNYSKLLEELAPPNCQVQDSSISVHDYIKEKLGKRSLSDIERAAYRFCDLVESGLSGTDGSTRQLSARNAGDYKIPEGANKMLPGGLGRLVKALEAQIPGESIHLETEVMGINYSNTSREVQVKLNNGEVHYADCVIWTPSVNVLKHFVQMKGFDPVLPTRKLDALEGRGQGVVDKVFACLEQQIEGFPEELVTPVLWMPSENEKRDSHWTRSIYALLYSAEAQLVSMWITGDAALTVEKLDSKKLLAELEEMLNLVYGREIKVRAAHRSQWGMNNFTRGSYSYPLVGSEPGMVEQLSAPIPNENMPLICFGGESTDPSFYSTMHGAMRAGIREAERVVSYLNKSTK